MNEEKAVYMCLPPDTPADEKDILSALLAPAPTFDTVEDMVNTMTVEGRKMEMKLYKISIELVEHRNQQTEHTNLEEGDE